LNRLQQALCLLAVNVDGNIGYNRHDPAPNLAISLLPLCFPSSFLSLLRFDLKQ
jgi:hypothetical protein